MPTYYHVNGNRLNTAQMAEYVKNKGKEEKKEVVVTQNRTLEETQELFVKTTGRKLSNFIKNDQKKMEAAIKAKLESN